MFFLIFKLITFISFCDHCLLSCCWAPPERVWPYLHYSPIKYLYTLKRCSTTSSFDCWTSRTRRGILKKSRIYDDLLKPMSIIVCWGDIWTMSAASPWVYRKASGWTLSCSRLQLIGTTIHSLLQFIRGVTTTCHCASGVLQNSSYQTSQQI